MLWQAHLFLPFPLATGTVYDRERSRASIVRAIVLLFALLLLAAARQASAPLEAGNEINGPLADKPQKYETSSAKMGRLCR